MSIITIPLNYCGVLSPVIFKIATEQTQAIEVEIIGGHDVETLGIKRFLGENEYGVNVSNYLKRRICVEPLSNISNAFVQAKSRSSIAQIRVGVDYSDFVSVTGGSQTCFTGKLLSNSPILSKISAGEKDELAFITDASSIIATATFEADNRVKEVRLSEAETTEGICVFLVDTNSIEDIIKAKLQDYKYMTVKIEADEHTIAQRKYQIAPRNETSIRLCWQNPYGQIDYFSFRMVDETIDVQKTRIRTNNGYNIIGADRITEKKATSEYEPQRTLNWLTEILSAPQVWIAGDNDYKSTDIITDKFTLNKGEPEAFSFTMREVDIYNHRNN